MKLALGLLVGLGVLLVGGGAVVYESDYLRTLFSARQRELTDWTPDNIAKHPTEYLDFCEQKVRGALDKVKSSRVSIAQARAKVTDMRDDAANKAAVGQTVLRELKDLYGATAKTNAWPVTYKRQPVDEAWVRHNVEQLHAQVGAKQRLAGKCDDALARLQAQADRLPDVESKANQQLAEIQSSREMLKIDGVTDGLKAQMAEMRGLVTDVSDSAASTGKPDNLDVNTLAAASATPAGGSAASDRDFQAILREK